MLVADVMDRGPVHVPLTMSFYRAAEFFDQDQTSELVVTDNGAYVGIRRRGISCAH